MGEELEAATAAAIDVDATGLEGLRAIFSSTTFLAARAILAGKPLPARTVKFFPPQADPVPEGIRPEDAAAPFVPDWEPLPAPEAALALTAVGGYELGLPGLGCAPPELVPVAAAVAVTVTVFWDVTVTVDWTPHPPAAFVGEAISFAAAPLFEGADPLPGAGLLLVSEPSGVCPLGEVLPDVDPACCELM